MKRLEPEQKIAVLLWDRAAGKLVFAELSTGAADDLSKATAIDRERVPRYGMDEGLGHVAFEPQRRSMLDLPAGFVPPTLSLRNVRRRTAPKLKAPDDPSVR